MTMITRGNGKLGTKAGRASSVIFHTDLPAGPSCPGASEWCSVHCYVKKGRAMMPAIQGKYASNLELLRSDPDAYEQALSAEVDGLKVGSVFRWHTSGDVDSLTHLGIIRRMAERRPDVTFYLYTRSWRTPWGDAIRVAGEEVPNLYVWASTDETMPDPPQGWRTARIFDTETDAREARYPVCPEQTGKRASCADCGLCWNARPDARLAFVAH